MRNAVRWSLAADKLTCFQMAAWIRFRSSSISFGNRTAKTLPLIHDTVASVRRKGAWPSFKYKVMVRLPPIAGSVVPATLQPVFERSFSDPLDVVNLAPSVLV